MADSGLGGDLRQRDAFEPVPADEAGLGAGEDPVADGGGQDEVRVAPGQVRAVLPAGQVLAAGGVAGLGVGVLLPGAPGRPDTAGTPAARLPGRPGPGRGRRPGTRSGSRPAGQRGRRGRRRPGCRPRGAGPASRCRPGRPSRPGRRRGRGGPARPTRRCGRAALVEGCSSSTRSSSSGTGRSGRPAATWEACSARGCGPAHSSRNAASAASKGSGPAGWLSMRKLQVSEAGGNEAPSSHPRSTWRVPAMYLAPGRRRRACTCRVPGVYLRCTWLVPAPAPPGAPRPAARYIRALTCAGPARYIAGTRQVQGMW